MSSISGHFVRYGIALHLLWQGLVSPVGAAGEEGIYQRQRGAGSIELSNVPEDDSFQLLIAAPIAEVAFGSLPDYAPEPNLRSLTSRVARFREMVSTTAERHSLDPRLLHALITVESGYNPQAISPKGAIGLMQLMPGTARRYGIQDPRDPQQNLQAGARYLSDLLRLFNNDVSLALAAYNAGEHAVIRHGHRIPPYRETEAYVPKVLALYRKFASLAI
jgi:soluble lytic murein transglycosylase-like protein